MIAQIVFWGFLILIALAPLPMASARPWGWSMLALCVGVLLILWALAALKSRRLLVLSWWQYGWAAVLFTLVLAWIFIQASSLIPVSWHHPIWAQSAAALGQVPAGSLSVDRVQTLDGALRVMSYAAIFWMAVQFGRDPARARQLLWVVSLAGFCYAAYGLFNQFSGIEKVLWEEKFTYVGHVTSTFISPNVYAVYAGLGLIATLCLLMMSAGGAAPAGLMSVGGVLEFTENLRPSFFILVVISITLATALLYTLSRGGLASAAVAVMVLFAALGLSREGQRRRILWFALGTFVVGVIVISISGEVTLGRMVSIAGGGPTGREEIHQLVSRAIAESPVRGWGFGAFERAFFMLRDESMNWDAPPYDKTHNLYLEFAVELGLIAGAAMLAVIADIVLSCLRGAWVRHHYRIYPCMGLAATALVGAQALFGFAIQIPAVAATYFALLGVAYAQSWRTSEADDGYY